MTDGMDFALQNNWAWQELDNRIEDMTSSPFVRSRQVSEHYEAMVEIQNLTAQFEGYWLH